MDEASKSTGIVILAAGASVRMREPKQLLRFEGKTLLRRAVETAVETNCASIVVVLGANSEKMKAEIANLKVNICFNEDWRQGLSSSLKTGLQNLLRINPKVDAFIVMLADQPFITAHHLHHFMIKFHQSKNPVIAAKYDGTTGVPALFGKEIFNEFVEISGDKGAKTIIKKHRQNLETIDLPEAAFDIDTKADYLKLQTEARA